MSATATTIVATNISKAHTNGWTAPLLRTIRETITVMQISTYIGIILIPRYTLQPPHHDGLGGM